MGKINFGVIGCGRIAQKSVIPALHTNDASNLVAVTDIDTTKTKIISKKYNVDSERNYHDLLKRKDIDAVYISTPIGLHAEMCIAAAKKGKHILCEKSLTSNLKETEEVLKICEENDVLILEGFMYQYHTQHAYVQNLIEEDKIGTPVHFHARFGFPPLDNNNFRYKKKLGGGALLDAGAYTVHAARKIFKKEPIRVEATMHNNNEDVEIIGNALMDFGKETASLVFGFDNYYQNMYSIWGTKGMISLTRAFSIPANLQPALILEQQNYKEEFILPACDHFKLEIKTFCSNMDNKDYIQKWKDDILNQAKVLDRIRSSSEKR